MAPFVHVADGGCKLDMAAAEAMATRLETYFGGLAFDTGELAELWAVVCAAGGVDAIESLFGIRLVGPLEVMASGAIEVPGGGCV
jgi:hypothetical protein